MILIVIVIMIEKTETKELRKARRTAKIKLESTTDFKDRKGTEALVLN